MITTEMLEKRLAELRAQALQAHANAHALDGAAALCEEFLKHTMADDKRQAEDDSESNDANDADTQQLKEMAGLASWPEKGA